jgi:hypothetical protein
MVHHEGIHRDVRVRSRVTQHLVGAFPYRNTGIIRKNNVMGTICKLCEEGKCRPLCVASTITNPVREGLLRPAWL